MGNRKTPILIYIIMTFFAANSLITRYLLYGEHTTPFTLTALRFLSGFLMLYIISFILPGFKGRLVFNENTLVGSLFLGIYAYSISYGYHLVSASSGVLVFYLSVVLTMSLVSVVGGSERFNVRTLVGVFLGLIGVMVITQTGFELLSLLGLFLMVSTGVSWGLYCVKARENIDSFEYTYSTFFLLSVFIILVSITGYAFKPGMIWVDSGGCFCYALFLGMVSTALSYFLWNNVIGELKPSQGALSQLIVPILTSLLGVLILREEFSYSLILGGALILMGIKLNS